MVRYLVEICDKDNKYNPGLFCVYYALSDATWNSTMYLKER